jgi:peptidoglycan pentaglycine glycine transferase (the first glycine)
MPLLTASAWDGFLDRHANAHILQTAAWGELKAAFGWEVVRVVAGEGTGAEAGAQILFRRLPLGFTLAYIPKGPVGNDWKKLWTEVDALCRGKRSILLKVEPDLWEHPAGNEPVSPPAGFHLSPHAIQPPRTLLVDLQDEEQTVLGRMKQKTRYNIRLALKKGVVVRPWSDVGTFYRLMQVTGTRDEFSVHSQEYFQKTYDLFSAREECELLLAEFEHEPLAAIMVFARGGRAWYFYGASSNEHRERMPAYLLQWEAMRWARAKGCWEYDLWGVPDEDEQTLEENFSRNSSGLWGVYRFKRGFGGRLCRSAGPWDRIYQPGLYQLYRWWIGRRKV